ncbi:MAG: hypothetical protein ACR2MA_08410 [Egibacteraceae bacterium]
MGSGGVSAPRAGARRRLAVGVLVLVQAGMLLTGCRLDAQLAIDVERSGGGTLRLVLAADANLVRRLRAADTDPLGQLARTVRQQEGWQVTRRATPDGGSRVTLRTSFADVEDLTRLTEELSAAVNGPELAVLEPFGLDIEGRTLTLRGRALLQPGPAVRDYGLTPAEAVALLVNREAVSYTVRVRMPGTVELTDGAVTPAGAVRYRVPPGSAVDVLVVAQRPRPWRLIVLVLTAVVALIAAYVLRRHRRRPA